MQSRLLFATLAVGLLALVTLPNASAQEVEVGILDCGTFTANYDGGQDSDVWSYCSTPQCGCYCPYAGAGVVVEAAGQERGVLVVASCQSGYATTSGSADGGFPVTVIPILGGGGLDSVETA